MDPTSLQPKNVASGCFNIREVLAFFKFIFDGLEKNRLALRQVLEESPQSPEEEVLLSSGSLETLSHILNLELYLTEELIKI